MSKLLWVALPLLAALALVLLRVLRGRRPSRLTLNVGSSLLLLAYLLTTAGLGIFWVANQQLPVFDWHYLFGYATVALVALHLVFNFPLVWRHLRHPRQRAHAVGRPVVPSGPAGRREALGAAGVLLAAGGAFALGLRQGRSELHVAVEPAAADGGSDGGSDGGAGAALAVVARFHAHSSQSRSGVLLRAPAAGWGEAPPPFKRYPGAPRLALPPAASASAAASAQEVGAAVLGSLLWHVAGVTAERGGLRLRASPSSGALFSTELYVAVRRVAGLAPGLWHFDAGHHALEQLSGAGHEALPRIAPDDPRLREAPAMVFATAVFGRTGQKYGERTYRYVLADLGHALENLRAAAAALGLAAQPLRRFDEALAAEALGVDEGEEGVLALVALMPSAGARVEPRAAPAAAPAPVMPGPATAWRTPDIGGAAALGMTRAVHAATSLRAAPARDAVAVPASIPLPRVPHALHGGSDVLARIRSRRSVRRYSAEPLPLPALAGVLQHLLVPAWLADAGVVRADVVAHAVQGLRPGVYRYEPAAHVLLPRRVSAASEDTVAAAARLREQSQAAGLGQDVIGDAAALIVLSIGRAAFAADPAGAARGYRHAFIEAGCAGERAYLAGGALGLGVCSVGAFYDADAEALLGMDPAYEWVLHFVALGWPVAHPG